MVKTGGTVYPVSAAEYDGVEFYAASEKPREGKPPARSNDLFRAVDILLINGGAAPDKAVHNIFDADGDIKVGDGGKAGDEEEAPSETDASNPATPGSTKPTPGSAQSFTTRKIGKRYGGKAEAALKHRSLFLFSPYNPFRRFCLRFVVWKHFDAIVTGVICLNCVILALDAPTLDPDDWRRKVSDVGEIAIAIVFVLELLLKCVSLGAILHQGSYLRDPWNVLDFAVVVLGLVGFLPSASNLTALRTFRLVKPLRTISSSASMRLLAGALLSSIPMLGDVLMLWGFVFAIFGLLGMQLWMGRFRNHCVREDGTVPPGLLDQVCGSSSYSCPEGLHCTREDEVNGGYLPNPNHDISSFDNFGSAFIAIFQTQTREGWSMLTAYTDDSWSPWGYIYWVLLILFGSFFVVNLATAVVFASFQRIAGDALGGSAPTLDGDSVSMKRIRAVGHRVGEMPENVPWFSRVRGRFYDLCQHWAFQSGVIAAIVFNTILLAIEHHNMPEGMISFLRACNLVFVVVFAIEMVIKLIGLGPIRYVKDKFNVFDGTIVIVSIVELGMGDGGPKGVSVLRTFRLLRVMKLLKNWVSLRKLIEVVARSLSSIANFVIILAIILFTYALLGLQLYAGKFCETEACSDPSVLLEAGCAGEWQRPDGETDMREWECAVPFRLHFDDLYTALLTCFLLFTAENWFIVMFEAMRRTSWEACFYFITLILIGHYMLLNLFLAGVVRNVVDAEGNHGTATESSGQMSAVTNFRRRASQMLGGSTANGGSIPGCAGRVANCIGLATEEEEEKSWVSGGVPVPVPMEEPKEISPDDRSMYSLYLFHKDHPLRVMCHRVITHRHFDNVFLPLIIISSITLAIESPHKDADPIVHDWLVVMDYIFNVLFTVELTLKVIALGFWSPAEQPYGKTYLRDWWNRLDFLIVLVSWGSAILDSPATKSLKALRTLRALRPLRLLNRNQGMKRVVESLIKVIPEIGNILMLLLLAYFIFGILGVQLLSGKMYSCSDPSRQWEAGYGPLGDGSDECLGNWTRPGDGLSVPREWSSPTPNFDNVPSAMLVLFEISTLEDWNEHMANGMDTTEVRRAMRRDASPANALYYVAFVLIGALFVSNLLVSAVVSYYIRADSGVELLTPGQQQWVQTMRQTLREKPERQPVPPMRTSHRFPLFKLISNPWFDVTIMAVIMLSVIALMCDHFDSSADFDKVSEIITMVFNAIFLIEAILKITGLGFVQYIRDNWNRFDLLVVVISFGSFIIDKTMGGLAVSPSAVRIFRVFRTARVLRMVRGLRGLRTLLRTFVLSLPSLGNVGSLLFLVYFVYAIVGMYLFGGADRNNAINSRANFETFPRGLRLLFRSCTGESWNAIMHELIDQGHWVAIPYFITFLLIAYFVMLNVFVAVILENFSEANNMEDSKLTARDFATYAMLWSEYDVGATLTMPSTQLQGFLQQLPEPLGLKGAKLTRTEKLKFLQGLRLENRGGEGVVHYHEVLRALAFRVAGSELPPEVGNTLDTATKRAFPSLKNLPNGTASIAEVWAAVRLQAAVRGMLNRKKIKRVRDQKLRAAKAAARISMPSARHGPASQMAAAAAVAEEESRAMERSIEVGLPASLEGAGVNGHGGQNGHGAGAGAAGAGAGAAAVAGAGAEGFDIHLFPGKQGKGLPDDYIAVGVRGDATLQAITPGSPPPHPPGGREPPPPPNRFLAHPQAAIEMLTEPTHGVALAEGSHGSIRRGDKGAAESGEREPLSPPPISRSRSGADEGIESARRVFGDGVSSSSLFEDPDNSGPPNTAFM